MTAMNKMLWYRGEGVGMHDSIIVNSGSKLWGLQRKAYSERRKEACMHERPA